MDTLVLLLLLEATIVGGYVTSAPTFGWKKISMPAPPTAKKVVAQYTSRFKTTTIIPHFTLPPDPSLLPSHRTTLLPPTFKRVNRRLPLPGTSKAAIIDFEYNGHSHKTPLARKITLDLTLQLGETGVFNSIINNRQLTYSPETGLILNYSGKTLPEVTVLIMGRVNYTVDDNVRELLEADFSIDTTRKISYSAFRRLNAEISLQVINPRTGKPIFTRVFSAEKVSNVEGADNERIVYELEREEKLLQQAIEEILAEFIREIKALKVFAKRVA